MKGKYCKLALIGLMIFLTGSCQRNQNLNSYIEQHTNSYQKINRIIISSDSIKVKYLDNKQIESIKLYSRDTIWDASYNKNGVMKTFLTNVFVDSLYTMSIEAGDTIYIDSLFEHVIGYYFYDNGMLRASREKKNDSCIWVNDYSEEGKLNISYYCRKSMY